MAKKPTITLYERFYNEGAPDLSNLIQLTGNASKAVFMDAYSRDLLTVEGKKLDYEHGVPTEGTIEKVTFANEDGKAVRTYSDLHIDASHVAGDTMYTFTQFLEARAKILGAKYIGTDQADDLSASAGNDRIIAGGGDDWIGGGHGKDVMTGGAGNDIFSFATGYGKDTITDFDAVGGDGAQDLIEWFFTDLVEPPQKDGKNTVLDFGDGDVLTLIGIKPGQIDATDFTM